MELFFSEAVLEVTMGGLEGRARDTGLAVETHTEVGKYDVYVCLCVVDKRVNLWTFCLWWLLRLLCLLSNKARC